MHKISLTNENPIDKIIYKFVEIHSEQLNDLTPNMITTISVIFGLISLYCFKKESFKTSALTFFLSYVYDCLDGYHARRKNMETKFGDYYDHLTDWILMFGILYLMRGKLIHSKYYCLLKVMLIIISTGCLIHIGCQELMINSKFKGMGESLNFTKQYCKNPKKMIKYSKFFGCGTLYTYIVIGIYLIPHLT
jgi:phosphatidylglycerophosphate synthase